MPVNRIAIALLALVVFGLCPQAKAQWAVIDVGAIAQLIQQLATLKQQLVTAENELSQAQAQYQSMTGSRGMQSLLPDTNRNYLPSNWSQLVAAMNHTGASYGALSTSIQSNMASNAILTPQQVAALPPADGSLLQTERSSAATLQALTQQALSTTSSRFASLQQLINAIGTATDQKSILELQARIQAEQAMLENEGTKLGILYQAVQAQELSLKQQARESAIAGSGSLRNLPTLQLQ